MAKKTDREDQESLPGDDVSALQSVTREVFAQSAAAAGVTQLLGEELAKRGIENSGRLATTLASRFRLMGHDPVENVTFLVILRPGGGGGGESIKLGNLELNLLDLLMAIGSGSVAVVGVSNPWILIVSSIVACGALGKAAVVKLDDEAAAVLWAMWKNRDVNQMLQQDGLAEVVNAELRREKFPELTEGQFNSAVGRLRQLKCIRPVKWTNGEEGYEICEWVRIDYP